MIVALLIALAVAGLAFAAGALTASGAAAAAVVGALCILAGWEWAALLIVYFVVAVACSRVGADAKGRRTGGIVAKAGRRDAVQVLANGGVFAASSFLGSRASVPVAAVLSAAALGALAAASADTLATEIGTLAGGEPRSVMGWRPVPAGTSGGISVAGSLGMVAGALLVALTARALGLGSPVLAVAVGGVAGALADSLLGASLQERRRCPRCNLATERRVHDCGTPTDLSGGVPWVDNDLVNLSATLVGAMVAATMVVA
jgi:uncharacterized protein (TIGR00297 family)